MSLYLCVDCGGSKTAAAISDASGKIVGRSFAGPSNIAYLTVEAFLDAIRTAVGEALKTCSSPASVEPVSLPPPPGLGFAAAWFGISGADSPAAIASVSGPLSTLLGIPEGPRLAVANDAHLLAAPVHMHADVSTAVTVIGGTGSIVVSFKETNGQLEELGRIGGWGWILGDEGGGFSVGREAVRQILEQYDRHSVMRTPAPEGSLRKRVLEYFNVKHVMELLTAVYIPDPISTAIVDGPAHILLVREKRLSSLSPLVFAAAFEDNDPLALNVLQTCAGQLAAQVAVLLGESSEEAPRLARAADSVISFGGSLVGLEVYRKMVLDELASKGHVFRHAEFVQDAAITGAIGLALQYNAKLL
ncbi:hypothetical protein K435DRAFT_869682 [Dendrothele bispora CBS 962.96]|uniref:N-acetyl-D-glucosamine kinase n=1 Tax=Dendrothele bispora (strain CBS 962.96) TaxID=1314807 RepID=A0A4S8L8Y6_DENBC|nr:hypothetical protein K435DRAFT_869682 [Dendrothele bispora CBS 962.96]